MPLMMDGPIDVDDLFGDPTSLELGLAGPQRPKGLAQRLDEMRFLGCCRKLAWSRLGCVAYISQDSHSLNVRHLFCRPADGKRVLSEDTLSHTVADGPGNHALVHLEWSETGGELAVVDAGGRVSVFTISIALNNVALHRQAIQDQADDGAQVVGMLWLNTQRSIHTFHQAAKLNGRWGYSPSQRRPIGPFNPFSKTALLCVTRSGILRFLYQQPDSNWTEISTELKVTNHSDRLLTHAALIPTPAGILIAVHSACQKIYVYYVNISWTPNNWDPNQARQGAATHTIPTPNFTIHFTKIEHPSSILGSKNTAADSLGNLSPSLSPFYSLTQLDIILRQPDSANNSASGPWILAVYSNSAHSLGTDPQQPTAASVIVRWQFESSSLTIHPKFDEVVSKRNVGQAKPRMELRRLEDFYSERFVVSVDLMEFGNVLAVTYDDSSVAFLDPKTMVSFNSVDGTNTVTSMAQAGFHYPLDTSGLHIAFSPTGCLAVVLDGDWQMRLRTMEHSFGSEEGLYDESKFSAAIAALALAFCRGTGSDINTDDILLIILRQLTSEAQNVFINEVYRALSIDCNFTIEQSGLMNHAYIPRCLSIQAALGFNNYYTSRNLASSVSWAILHLRHASVLYAFFYQYNKGTKDVAEPYDADVLRMILGNTKWVLGFYHFVVDELFGLAAEFEPVFSDSEAFAQKVKSKNSLALILIFSSMSRAFLRFICRGLRGIHAAFPTAPAVGEARIYYRELCDAMEAAPIKVETFEKLLAGVDSAVRHAYQGAGFGDNERSAPEKELLVNSRIPAVLVSAVSAVLRQTLPSLSQEIDRLAMYLGDYSWVGFGSDRRTEFYRRTHEIDIVKKIPLRKVFGTQQSKATEQQSSSSTAATAFLKASKLEQADGGRTRRRCVRCCEVSGDIGPPRSLLWLRMIVKLQLLRSCVCGGMWAFDSSINLWEPNPASSG